MRHQGGKVINVTTYIPLIQDMLQTQNSINWLCNYSRRRLKSKIVNERLKTTDEDKW